MDNKIKFPKSLLAPVVDFLNSRLAKLRKNKKNISSEDPFNDKQRTLDNAALDSEAEEQYGHARVSAIKKELNKKASQIKKALLKIKKGTYGICESCGKMIDTDRLSVFPEATKCINCEKKSE